MSFSYYFYIQINNDLESINTYIQNSIISRNQVNSRVVGKNEYPYETSDLLHFDFDSFRADVAKADEESIGFIDNEYKAKINYALDISPNLKMYDSLTEIMKFVSCFLKDYDGDCVMEFESGANVLVRKDNEIIVDETFLKNNNMEKIPLIDVPYIIGQAPDYCEDE